MHGAALTDANMTTPITLDACSIILEEIRALSKKIDALVDRVPLAATSRKRKDRGDGEPAQICSGKTAKGQPCNHRALAGLEYCKMHDPMRKSKATGSTESLVKIEPIHSHAPSEQPTETCELCETQGDPLNDATDDDVDEEDVVDEYLVDKETNDRLRELLREHDL